MFLHWNGTCTVTISVKCKLLIAPSELPFSNIQHFIDTKYTRVHYDCRLLPRTVFIHKALKWKGSRADCICPLEALNRPLLPIAIKCYRNTCSNSDIAMTSWHVNAFRIIDTDHRWFPSQRENTDLCFDAAFVVNSLRPSDAYVRH